MLCPRLRRELWGDDRADTVGGQPAADRYVASHGGTDSDRQRNGALFGAGQPDTDGIT